jgi:hypothetical protein
MTLKNFFRKIVRTYKRMTDAAVLPFAQNVYNKVNGNPLFPTPTPDMPTLLTAITNYSDALSAALNRDREKVALKNSAKFALISMLDELANYITLVANGNLDTILAAGFEVNKIPGTVTIDTPVLVFMNGDNPGELVTIADNASNAKGVVHEITADPLTENSVWRSVASTVKSHTFTGLQKGVNYWGRVTAIGGNQQRMVSGPASRIVQ